MGDDDQILATFKLYDKNGDGLISREEFGSLMADLNPEMFSDSDNVDALMSHVDGDQDGHLDYQELLQWISGGGDTPRELREGLGELLEGGRRMRCKYGAKCRRKGAEHFAGLCHPGDWDWDLEGEEAEGLDESSSLGGKEGENEGPTNADVGPVPDSELVPPEYWTQQGGEDEGDLFQDVPDEIVQAIQQLVTSTFKQVKTSDRRSGKMPTGLEVVKVQRVENLALWRRYAEYRWRMGAKRPHKCTPFARVSGEKVKTDVEGSPLATRLRDRINETYLWHGCSPEAAEGISRQGFLLKLAGTGAGSMYGNGIYLAECSSKSDEYATPDAEEDCCNMLLCRGALGEMLKMTQGGDATHMMISAAIACGSYESVLGDREASVGTYREFICYDEAQVYPEYLVQYRRSFYVEPPPLPDEVLPEKVPKKLIAVLEKGPRTQMRAEYMVSTDLLHGTLQFTRGDSKLCASSGRETWQLVLPGGQVGFEAPYSGPIPPTSGWESAQACPDNSPDSGTLHIEFPADKPPPLRRGYIENVKTGLVWDIQGANRNRGAAIQTWSKNGQVNQLWTLTPEGKLKSELNGLVLGIGGYRKNRGQRVVTWNDGGADKFWELTPEGIFESKWCGLAIGISHAKSGRGGTLVTWDKSTYWDKVWKFTPHPKA